MTSDGTATPAGCTPPCARVPAWWPACLALGVSMRLMHSVMLCCTLPHDIGWNSCTCWLHPTLWAGLAWWPPGSALGMRAHASWSNLLQHRVCMPLNRSASAAHSHTCWRCRCLRCSRHLFTNDVARLLAVISCSNAQVLKGLCMAGGIIKVSC